MKGLLCIKQGECGTFESQKAKWRDAVIKPADAKAKDVIRA